MRTATLAHLMDVDFLTRGVSPDVKTAHRGIDGVTAATVCRSTWQNLRDLHERLRSGRYQAPPVKRALGRQGGRKSTPDRVADVRGQARAARRDHGAGSDHEEDFHEFARLSAWAQRAPGTLRALGSSVGYRDQLDRGRRQGPKDVEIVDYH